MSLGIHRLDGWRQGLLLAVLHPLQQRHDVPEPSLTPGEMHKTPSVPGAGATSSSSKACREPIAGESSGRRRRQPDRMAVNAQPLTDDEERLAALWAQPPDDASDRALTDDGTARAHRTAARRSPRDRRRGSPSRRAGSQVASRSLVVGIVVVLMLTTVAVSALTSSTDSADTVVPAAAERTGAPTRPARSPRGEPELRQAPAAPARARRDRVRRTRPTPAAQKRPRAARSTRVAPPPPPRSTRSAPPLSQPAAPPTPTAGQRQSPPSTAPASSACDEFPPC